MSGSALPAGWKLVHPEWVKRCEWLPQAQENSQWILLAVPRNAPAEAVLEERAGVHGFRRAELVKTLWQGLQRAYQFLLAEGRSRLPDHEPRLLIYLYAVDDPDYGCETPLTDQLFFLHASRTVGNSPRLGTVMALPVRSNEPQWKAELAQLLTAAIHELSHGLNFQVLPLRDPRPHSRAERERERLIGLRNSWHWLDEGMAVAAEAAFAQREQKLRRLRKPGALPMNDDWLRFALDWVDRPECALDDEDHFYQAAFFVRYVHRLMGGPKFLNEVWTLSSPLWNNDQTTDCSALAMLAQAFQQSQPSRVFCSVTEPDVFSDYCFHGYFLNDKRSLAFEPKVFKRFGERAVTRTWRMADRAAWPAGMSEKYSLPGLACRYFRFFPMADPKWLSVRVLPPSKKSGESFRQLKAEIGFAMPGTGLWRRSKKHLPLRHTLTFNSAGELECKLDGFSKRFCDHAVLVVTNCEFGSPAPGQAPPNGFEHSTDFCVQARLR